MSTSGKTRTSIVRVVLFVLTLSLGALALSPSALGAEKKTLKNLSESYSKSLDQLDPSFWSFIQ